MTNADDVTRLIKAQFKLHERDSATWNRVYTKYIDALRGDGSILNAADLSSGRGERLVFLRESDVNIQGAEIDEELVTACRAVPLPVDCVSPVDFLSKARENYFDIIFMSNFSQTIDLGELAKIFELVLPVLKPGGLFVFEVSEPWSRIDNLRLHPAWRNAEVIRVLALLPAMNGYSRTKIELLGLDAGTTGPKAYAIIAQKSASDGVANLPLDRIWEQAVSLEPNSSVVNLTRREESLKQEIAALQQVILDLQNSTSWRVTKPLRFLSTSIARSKKKIKAILQGVHRVSGVGSQILAKLQPLVTFCITKAAASPTFRRGLAFVGSFLPAHFKEQLRIRYFAARDERYFARRSLKQTARGAYIFATLSAAIVTKKSD